MDREVTINPEQKLYGIPEGSGWTALGFDVAYARARAVWQWVEDGRTHTYPETPETVAQYAPPEFALVGTLAGYTDYERVMLLGRKHHLLTRATLIDWGQDTPQAVKDALLTAQYNAYRVRLFYGDAQTGRDWGEENDVTGTVSASTGWFKCLLLLASQRSSGGPAILTGSIVRLLVNGREVYRHPTYSQPHYRLDQPADQPNGLPARVCTAWDGDLQNWSNVANFQTWAQAARWIDFMRGRRASK
jgi:hypothetical protein